MKYIQTFILLLLAPLVTAAPDTFLNNGVTAHRGDSGNYPQNTLPAFKSALALGVDWIELDIFMTRDKHIVVIHDATTEKVGERTLRISETDYAALKTLDVAHAFRTRNKLTIEECPPARIPLLSEVLTLMKTQDKTRISIQPKQPIVDEAMDLINTMDAQAWVGFNDGDLAKMARVKELAPAIPVFWDRGPTLTLSNDIAIAKEHGFEVLVYQYTTITKESIQTLHNAGFGSGAWTVNDSADLKHLLNLGVHRIYTDYPGLLLILKAERKD